MEDKHRYFVIAMDVGKHRVLYRGCQRLNREYSPVTYIRTQRDSSLKTRGREKGSIVSLPIYPYVIQIGVNPHFLVALPGVYGFTPFSG